ncbi:MAG: FxsA family protein [Alphaproteobacteria bacterium]
MPILLFLILVATPIAEIAILIAAGNRIGLWPTIGLVVGTAFIGSIVMRAQGQAALLRARQALARNEMPLGEVFTALFLVIAGALLLTPGFVTDAVGFTLLVPPIRDVLGRRLLKFILDHGTVEVRRSSSAHRPGPTVIEGEFEDAEPEPDDDASDTRWGRGPGSRPGSPPRRS